MWQDAMADLNEQLHVEGIDEEDDGRKTVSFSLYISLKLKSLGFS
jgi:hypothetical protein